jgi:hypothetical protein
MSVQSEYNTQVARSLMEQRRDEGNRAKTTGERLKSCEKSE